MTEFTPSMIADLERDIAADTAKIAELRESAEKRADAIANEWAGKDDVAELQREQSEAAQLEGKVAATEGALRAIRAKREEKAAKERAAGELAGRQRVYGAARADADQTLSVAPRQVWRQAQELPGRWHRREGVRTRDARTGVPPVPA